jgi:selenide,water dikinase
LLIGAGTNDDACVYRLTEEIAIAQTVDFFPPMVDDPYLFGQIAAANALSDIYAMGAKPFVAMNLLCFPSCLDASVAQRILAGGADKAAEAGCVIAGGHSIADDEPKYGLCVTGLIHPERILANVGARAGDVLLLTKKVGTGLAVTARKGNLLPEADTAEAFESMRALNRRAAEIAADFTIHACTDVTGFGVAGHVCEVAEGSDVTAVLRAASLPLLPHAMELALEGIFPGGMYRNKEYYADKVELDSGVPAALANLFFDPQTSGGLLFSVPTAEADRLLDALRKEIPATAIIGEVAEAMGKPLHIIP